MQELKLIKPHLPRSELVQRLTVTSSEEEVFVSEASGYSAGGM